MALDLKNLLQNFNLPFAKSNQDSVTSVGLVGIRFSATNIFLAYAVGNTREDLKIVCLLEKPATSWEERTAALTSMVQEYNLEGQKCNVVLTPQDARLTMIEKPGADVEDIDEEIALSIQDYLNYEVADAVIDHFNLPFSRSSDGKQVVFAATTKLSIMQEIENCVTAAGLIIEAIDIPEFCYRNLNCLNQEQEKGYMLINMGNAGATIYTYNNANLIMSRRIEFDLSKFAVTQETQLKPDVEDEVLDSFTVQLQRSIDYCNSVFRQAPVEKLIFFSSETNVEAVSAYLSQQLGIKTGVFDLSNLIAMPEGFRETNYKQYYAAIGASLRTFNFNLDNNTSENNATN